MAGDRERLDPRSDPAVRFLVLEIVDEELDQSAPELAEELQDLAAQEALRAGDGVGGAAGVCLRRLNATRRPARRVARVADLQVGGQSATPMPAVMARCDSPRTTLAHAAEPTGLAQLAGYAQSQLGPGARRSGCAETVTMIHAVASTARARGTMLRALAPGPSADELGYVARRARAGRGPRHRRRRCPSRRRDGPARARRAEREVPKALGAREYEQLIRATQAAAVEEPRADVRQRAGVGLLGRALHRRQIAFMAAPGP